MVDYDKPLPKTNELNAPYWEAARKHKLRIQKCRDCGQWSADFSRLCMNCGHEALEWTEASGQGTVWSYGIFHKSYFPSFVKDAPYNVAIVQLDEGPRVYTNLVGVSNDAIRIGMPVRTFFDDVTDTATLIKFEPA